MYQIVWMKLISLLQLLFASFVFSFCNHLDKQVEQLAPMQANQSAKAQLYELERTWLEYEFAADIASIAAFMDSGFIAVSPDEVSNKKTELDGVYQAVTKMKADSIFIDSFKIEEPFIVKQFDNTAVTVFVCHTYKTSKGDHSQRRTRFYDVWRNVNGEWKAMSSQATTIEEIK